jgi:hypothetical protein
MYWDNTGLACQKVKFLASNAKNNTTSSSISIIILSPPTLVYQWLLYKRKPSGWNRSLDEFSPRFIGLGDDLESIVLSIARKPLFRVDTEDYRMEQGAPNIKWQKEKSKASCTILSYQTSIGYQMIRTKQGYLSIYSIINQWQSSMVFCPMTWRPWLR